MSLHPLIRDGVVAQAEREIGETIARVMRQTGETVVCVYITSYNTEPPTVRLLMARSHTK